MLCKGIYRTFFIRQSGNTVCSGYLRQECTSPALPLCPRALLVICKLSVTMYSVSHRSVVSTVPVLDVRKSNCIEQSTTKNCKPAFKNNETPCLWTDASRGCGRSGVRLSSLVSSIDRRFSWEHQSERWLNSRRFEIKGSQKCI